MLYLSDGLTSMLHLGWCIQHLGWCIWFLGWHITAATLLTEIPQTQQRKTRFIRNWLVFKPNLIETMSQMQKIVWNDEQEKSRYHIYFLELYKAFDICILKTFFLFQNAVLLCILRVSILICDILSDEYRVAFFQQKFSNTSCMVSSFPQNVSFGVLLGLLHP